MTLTANVLFQKTGGSDSAGGAFDPSQTAGMYTDLVIVSGGNTSSPVVSSASYNFNSATDPGHWLFIATTTNSWFAGWYKIASCASNQATLAAAAPVVNAGGYVTTPGQSQSYAPLQTGGAYQTYALNGQFYPNTSAGCSGLSTQSTNKATWAIDRSRVSGGAIFWNGTGATSSTVTLTYGSGGLPSTYVAGKQDVGNVIQALTGTAITVSLYTITAASSTTYTLDRSPGTSVTTWSLGGSFATIGGFGLMLNATGVAQSGQRLYLTGKETIASTTANVATGKLSYTSNLIPFVMEGFGATCGDLLPGAYISAGSQTTFNMTNWGFGPELTNIVLDGNAGASVIGVNGGTVSLLGCLLINFSGTSAIGSGTAAAPVRCFYYNCKIGSNAGTAGTVDDCVFDLCGTAGVSGILAAMSDTIFTACVSAGVSAGANNSWFTRCVFYKSSSGPGATVTGTSNYFDNSVFYGNSTFGVNTNASSRMVACAYGSNTSGNVNTLPLYNTSQVALTSDPYVGNHIGGATDLVVDGTHNTWVTTATNKTVGGGGTAQGTQDIGLKLIIFVGTGWTPGIYQIVDFDAGTSSWILNASPAATSTTGGSWRIADFRPNNVAGGGASLRATGIGAIGQVDAIDIGAVQHASAAAASSGGSYAFCG